MQASVDHARQVVRLNVGGTVFVTTKETLLGVDPTQRNYFAGLLRDDLPQTTIDGALFVDRDPSAFAYILSYLRSGVLRCPEEMLNAVLEEAIFYGVALPHAQSGAARPVRSVETLVLHCFGGATSPNFVKAVQVAIYGPLDKVLQDALEEVVSHYEVRNKNVFELPQVRHPPTMSAVLMCVCFDMGIVHAFISVMVRFGWKVDSHSDVVLPDVVHQKTASTFARRDITVVLHK